MNIDPDSKPSDNSRPMALDVVERVAKQLNDTAFANGRLQAHLERFEADFASVKRELQTLRELGDRLDARNSALEERNRRLVAMLRKVRDAMMTWYSSEYAEHPLNAEVLEILVENAKDSAVAMTPCGCSELRGDAYGAIDSKESGLRCWSRAGG